MRCSALGTLKRRNNSCSMDQKPITIVLSDLHVGGGKSDPGDDHVSQKNQFSRLLSRDIPGSEAGKVELIINGDFLEFAQVRTDAYTLNSAKYWCSETESLEKLSAMVSGHEDIFLGLREFVARGNEITIAAGNHDVDLYWPKVQAKIRSIVGTVSFEVGQVWYSRYDGKLTISHGHMFDPANVFKKWESPILKGPRGVKRLEMCAGTLFMVKFVNWLEFKYPFADNIKPVTVLADLLSKEPNSGYEAAVWVLTRFAVRHPRSALSSKTQSPPQTDFGAALIQKLALNDDFAQQIADLYPLMGERKTTVRGARKRLRTEDQLLDFMKDVLVKLFPNDWLPVLRLLGRTSLGVGQGRKRSLSVVRSGISKDKENLRERAKSRLANSRAEIVVCGHTHQPDEWRGPMGTSDGGYFNPGSWTRFLDISKIPNLTLADLKREEDFPYQLNYVRVEQPSKGNLRAEMICYEKKDGDRWSVK